MTRFYLIPHGVLALGEGKWHGWLFERNPDNGKFIPLRKLDDEFIARAERAASKLALQELKLEEDGGEQRH